MTSVERTVARLLRLVGYVVVVSSGVFMMLYLYRWEWNRAMLSGLFFVAAETALAMSAILRRLRRIEQRLDEHDTRAPLSSPPDDHTDRGPFAWLEDTQGHDVFVPVLLGVGVILSAVAWLVERIASASWSLGGDTAAQRRLRRVGTSAGSLSVTAEDVGAPAEAVRFRPPPERVGLARRAASLAVAVIVVASVLFASVYVLASLTMYRPDPVSTGGSTTYALHISLRSAGAPEASIAETLWLSCRAHVPDHDATIVQQDGGRFLIVVEPVVGRNDGRRLIGCLEDVRLDRILTDVLSTTEEGVETEQGLPPEFATARGWRPG